MISFFMAMGRSRNWNIHFSRKDQSIITRMNKKHNSSSFHFNSFHPNTNCTRIQSKRLQSNQMNRYEKEEEEMEQEEGERTTRREIHKPVLLSKVVELIYPSKSIFSLEEEKGKEKRRRGESGIRAKETKKKETQENHTTEKEEKKIFIDCTFGFGGHSRAILERYPKCTVIGIDQDSDSIESAFEIGNQYPDRFFFVKGKFSHVLQKINLADLSKRVRRNKNASTFIFNGEEEKEIVALLKKVQKTFSPGRSEKSIQFKVDGVLMDIGVSSHQLDSPERGFSFRFGDDSPLDMRMDGPFVYLGGTPRDNEEEEGENQWVSRPLLRTSHNQNLDSPELTAFDIINGYSEKDLAEIFYKYGEDSLARKIAAKICHEREKYQITTTGQLALIVHECYSAKYRSLSRKNPATKVFQALRIFLNDEVENAQYKQEI